MSTILAAQHWRTNADMMANAVAPLWIRPDAKVYDPTYGKGGFWKKFRPEFLVYDDLNPEKGFGGDFRKMGHPDKAFDVVVFDPAYVTPGGRDTTGIPLMNAAYGMDTTKMTLGEQWDDIKLGMAECARVLDDEGLMMQKGMNYISSGDYQNYLLDIMNEMNRLGLKIVDIFYFIRKHGGPQPKNRTRKCDARGCNGSPDPNRTDINIDDFGCHQCNGTGRIASVQAHASNNLSFLIVAQK